MQTADDARQRAAATKRERTRKALMSAAIKLVEHHGTDIRMEQVAQEAGVSVATAYNYFRTIHHLLAELTDALLTDVLLMAWSPKEPPWEGIEIFVRELSTIAHLYPGIISSYLSNLNIGFLQLGTLIELINRGMRNGDFNPDLDASAVASYHVLAMLTQVALRPEEPPDRTADFMLSQLLPVLTKLPRP